MGGNEEQPWLWGQIGLEHIQPSLVGLWLIPEDLPHILGFGEDLVGTLALALCWAGERAP